MTTSTASTAALDDAIDDATLERAWAVLEAVPDPEIPVVSIRELGILRDVRRTDDGTLEVVITPTYSGCPAMSQIAEDVAHALDVAGLTPYRIATVLAPAWTTDWMTVEARDKLRAYGIAPPSEPRAVVCPRCAAADVQLVSRFDSTPCKALYRCNACREPFDHFKCH